MPKRESVLAIERRWATGAGEPVVFVPDLRVLTLVTPAECLAMSRRYWRLQERPVAVCLPLVGVDGVAFENSLTPARLINAKVSHATAAPKTIGEIANDFAALGCEIFLYAVPPMQFLEVESCHKLDIRGKGSPEACVHRRATREFLNYLIVCGIDHVQEHLDEHPRAIRGLVIDITDLWGMSSGPRGSVYPTCFCDECREYLGNANVPLTEFETFPNPWELLLKGSGDGVSYIDNVAYAETAPSLVGKAALQGFGMNFRSEAERLRAAGLLMQYMVARHEMVEDFLTAIYQEAYTAGPSRQPLQKVVLVEGVEYDWAAGVFPGRLSPAVIDEVWMNPTDSAPPLSSRHKIFMWRRATYYLNAFFQFLTDVGDARIRTTTGMSRLPSLAVRAMLRDRGALALHNGLGVQQLAALPHLDSSQRDGFVGVVFTDEMLDSLVSSAYVAPGLRDRPNADTPQGSITDLLHALLREGGEAAPSEDEADA